MPRPRSRTISCASSSSTIPPSGSQPALRFVMSGGHKIPNRMPSKFSAPHMREGLRKKRLTSLPSQRLHPSPASGVVPTAASLARRHGSKDVTQYDRKIWVIWSQRRQPRARVWTRRSSGRGCSETEQARMNGKRGIFQLVTLYLLLVLLSRQSCTNFYVLFCSDAAVWSVPTPRRG